ncbi:MAG: hypothetical protein GY730_05385 [bacterium]|nr:hypothetical protein [bacterium]
MFKNIKWININILLLLLLNSFVFADGDIKLDGAPLTEDVFSAPGKVESTEKSYSSGYKDSVNYYVIKRKKKKKTKKPKKKIVSFQQMSTKYNKYKKY